MKCRNLGKKKYTILNKRNQENKQEQTNYGNWENYYINKNTPRINKKKGFFLNVELYFIFILYSVLLPLYYSISFIIMYYRFSLKKRDGKIVEVRTDELCKRGEREVSG